VTYRDRPLQCPRCTTELVRDEHGERWQCRRCHGALLDVAEVVRELLEVAPELMPSGGVRGLTTLGRRTKDALITCTVCGGAMEPVFLAGLPVDRCYHDQLLWLDAGELAQVLQRAEEQFAPAAKGWFVRLHEWLFPD